MDKRKHIIIAGVPRAGKTTLCSYIASSLKYQHLAMDAIVIALESAFPKINVRHTDRWEFKETSKNWINFIKEIVTNDIYEKLPYRLVLDIYHITPKEYNESIDRNNCDIYFLGYPNISLEEKFKEIRELETVYDWTSKKSNQILKEHIKDYIEISKWLQSECKKYEISFIDVSNNRDTILKQLSKQICI